MDSLALKTEEKSKKLINSIRQIMHYEYDIKSEKLIDEGLAELAKMKTGEIPAEKCKRVQQVMKTLEFEKGQLLLMALPEEYRAFGLDYFRNIQIEHNCNTPTERSLAESISLCFMQTLFIQKKITAYLGLESISDTGIKYLGFLSVELDKAHKRYLSSLQILTSIKNPQAEMNVRAQTAIIGNNQLIQSNNNTDVDKVSQSTI